MDGGVRTRAWGDKEAGNGIHTRRTSKRWEDVNLEDGVSMVVREKEGDRQSGGEGSREGKQDGGGDGGEEGREDGRTGEGGLTGFTQAGCSPGPVIGRVDGLEELRRRDGLTRFLR